MSNEFIARKGLIVQSLTTGTTESQILVVDNNGLLKVRTNLTLSGSSGSSGTSGTSGASGSSGTSGTSGTASMLGFNNQIIGPISSSTVYTNSLTAQAPTTVVAGTNRLILTPYIPYITHTATTIGLEVTASATTNNNCRILIYSDSNGHPENKLLETTSLDCSTNGIKTFITGFTFQSGVVYWMGTHAQSNFTLRAIPLAACYNLGGDSGTTVAAHNSCYFSTPTFGSAPDPYSGGFLDSRNPALIRITTA